MNEMNQLHYPDFERCKKLTELGFPWGELHWLDTQGGKDFPPTIRRVGLVGDYYVCPSVMEMVDVIPKKKVSMSVNIHPRFVPVSVDSLFYDFDHKNFGNSSNANIPNAIADLIIWLIENSHLTFDKR